MKEIEKFIGDLLAIVKELKSLYPKKEFTLDGKLVGDIGEVLTEKHYDISLNTKLIKHYDAISNDGKQQVQIKATMKNSLTFPVEIFNGPGQIIADYLRDHMKPKTNLHNLSVAILQDLNKKVNSYQRVKSRK